MRSLNLSKVVVTLGALALSVLGGGRAEAQGRPGVVIANGPFTYHDPVAGSATFLGVAGGPAYGAFSVCAPGPGAIFPAGDPSATASIGVFDIEKVAAVDGTPLVPAVSVPGDSSLGTQIAGAFLLSPSSALFYPGSCEGVAVSVSNPMVADGDLGDYVVTMKAQAVGSGIGVGSGSRFLLSLRPATLIDDVPPTLVINAPGNGSIHVLGPVDIEITANDPEPGTGVDAISATISSAGGAVNSLAIPLLTNVPQPAGLDATGAATFIPVGGTGPAGTTLAGAFTSASLSGIGTYTINATATDGAGNQATASATFQVKYDVEFTQQAGQIVPAQGGLNSVGRFKFIARRSAITSDGAFMYDTTVVVELVKVSDGQVMRTHTFTGPGAGVQNRVLIEVDPVYHTNFRRGDLVGPPSGADSYKARVYFTDVDGNRILQAESAPVMF